MELETQNILHFWLHVFKETLRVHFTWYIFGCLCLAGGRCIWHSNLIITKRINTKQSIFARKISVSYLGNPLILDCRELKKGLGLTSYLLTLFVHIHAAVNCN